MKALTREQIREIDRRAIEEYGIPGIILMENAGRNATRLLLDYLKTHSPTPHSELGAQNSAPSSDVAARFSSLSPQSFMIFCGGGNNGGDGFVIARHLHNLRHSVQVVLVADPDRLAPDARVNFLIASRMKIPIHPFDEKSVEPLAHQTTVLIDALLGTGFSGEVRPPLDHAIDLFNQVEGPQHKVAVDVPSGLDCDTGQPATYTIRADLTITFVASKIGFDLPSAKPFVGRVLVADIGAPIELLESL